MDEYDPVATYMNLLTATEPESTAREGPLPLALPTDREAIETAMYSAAPNGSRPLRVCHIRNTAMLEDLWISEVLLPEARQNHNLSIE